jgi:hypothetical protein
MVQSACASSGPDLSYIAEPLRLLATPLDSLALDPANVRRHPEQNMEAIKGSLRRFGQQKPIVVGSDGVIVVGNGTVEAPRTLGLTQVTAVGTELNGSDRTAYAIADHRTAHLAEWGAASWPNCSRPCATPSAWTWALRTAGGAKRPGHALQTFLACQPSAASSLDEPVNATASRLRIRQSVHPVAFRSPANSVPAPAAEDTHRPDRPPCRTNPLACTSAHVPRSVSKIMVMRHQPLESRRPSTTLPSSRSSRGALTSHPHAAPPRPQPPARTTVPHCCFAPDGSAVSRGPGAAWPEQDRTQPAFRILPASFPRKEQTTHP